MSRRIQPQGAAGLSFLMYGVLSGVVRDYQGNIMEQTVDAAVAIAMEMRAGKYLTFCLANEDYGLEILKVREIISMCKITTVPQTPEFIKGVINLRGKVIPIVDLRLKFVMDEARHTDETCIIVVNVGEIEMGIIVDKVLEVMNIPAGEIEDTPSFGMNVNTEFILGIGKAGGKVTILLDVEKVLTGMDIGALQSETQAA